MKILGRAIVLFGVQILIAVAFNAVSKVIWGNFINPLHADLNWGITELMAGYLYLVFAAILSILLYFINRKRYILIFLILGYITYVFAICKGLSFSSIPNDIVFYECFCRNSSGVLC